MEFHCRMLQTSEMEYTGVVENRKSDWKPLVNKRTICVVIRNSFKTKNAMKPIKTRLLSDRLT